MINGSRKTAFAVMILIISAFALFSSFAFSVQAQEQEKSDATPEYAPPKPLSDAEVSALDVTKLREIARMDSIEHKSPLAYFCLGAKYRQNKETVTAIDSFKQVVEKYSGHYLAPKACLEMASIYDETKNYSAEIEILNRMVRDYLLYPDTEAGLMRLSLAYRSAGLIDNMYRTLDTLENRIGDKKEAIPVLFTSANEYLKNYNSKSAIVKFDKLLAIKDLTNSQRAQALIGKAAAYEYMASTKEAGLAYEEILKMEIIEKPVRDMAEKSIKQLAKAPATPLIKQTPNEGAGSEGQAAPSLRHSGRVSEAVEDKTSEAGLKRAEVNKKDDPAAKAGTAEVKVRITD